MKKKIPLTLAAVLCALFCVLGVAACSSLDKTVNGSGIRNDYIQALFIRKEGSDSSTHLADTDRTYYKGKYTIQVRLYNRYGMGDMKMLVNGVAVALTPAGGNDVSDFYECEYNVTEDFKITFSGEVERKAFTISVEYTADNWQDRIDESYALRVKLLVNERAPAAPFESLGDEDGVSLESFIEQMTDNSITVKADDHVDIYVYSKLSKYTVNGSVLNKKEGNKMEKESFIDNMGRGVRFQIEMRSNSNQVLELSTHMSDISVQS